MIVAIVLFFVGVFLSAFFSGSETGFYRATRVRLTMDAMSGDLTARGLLWLTNNPTLFVATTLIGNNLANYVVSLAIVLGTVQIYGDSDWVGVIAPIAFSPLVFVYGELLPKNLFFQAPNRLLSLGGPLFLFCCLLFMPVSAILWLLGRVLAYVVGESPERLQLSLARKELQRVFDEGHQVGILRPAQRRLAHEMLTMANQSVARFATPVARFASIRLGTSKEDLYRLARRLGTSTFLVTESRGRNVVGYVNVIDLRLLSGDVVDEPRALIEILESESPIRALMRMQADEESLARVVDGQGKTRGVVNANVLLRSLLRDGPER